MTVDHKNKKFNLSQFKKTYRNIFASKIFIAIICFLIGASGAVLANNISTDPKIKEEQVVADYIQNVEEDFIHDPFNNDFFDHSNFLKDMQRMQDRFDKIFTQQQQYLANLTNRSSYINSHVTASAKVDLKVQHNEDEISYLLSYKGYDKDDIIVKVIDDSIIFKAKKVKSKEGNGEEKYLRSQSSSSFHYSLALPKDAIADDPKIIREDGLLKVTFDKNT